MKSDPKAAPEIKSKSQLKRDAEAAQELGRALVELPAARYAAVMSKLALPDKLRDALDECRIIDAHGARRRQLQFVGKLMRAIDGEPIRQALAALEGKDRTAAAEFHRLERWRERLLDEGDPALGELVDAYPHADSQHLRQLIMKARKELHAEGSSPAARTLFRYLRELADEEPNGEE